MKGLLFSEPMVKAWMEGRKSVTRRLVKVSSEWEPGYTHCVGDVIQDVHFYGPDGDCIVKPPYLPGETVYIKEAWAYHDPLFDDDKAEAFHVAALIDPSRIIYRASSPEYLKRRWRSPRFMPEWASRSKALIVSVRPERVQSITPEEVKREGFVVRDFAGIGVLALLGLTPETYMESVAMQEFQSLWETLHPGSREKNDWVWRIELEKI